MLTPEEYMIPEHVPPCRDLHGMLEASCRRFASRTAFQMRAENGGYRRTTYAQLWEESGNLARRLVSLGVRPGDRVVLQGENRPEWPIAYFAVMRTKGWVVPMDAQLSAADAEFILDHSGAGVMLVSGSIWAKLWKDRISSRTGIRHVVVFDPVETTDPRVISLDECLRTGATPAGVLPGSFSPEDTHAILYTSGTTGNPKAVELTHGNLASNVNAIHRMIRFDENDAFISVLPLHHVFECTVGLLSVVAAGAATTYAESLKSSALLANIRETGATLIVGVPLLFEKIHYGILRAVHRRPLHVRAVFRCMLWLTRTARLLGIEAGRALFRSLREKAGLATIRLAISGGGPLPYVTARGFAELGIRLMQGYGLSETSPVLTVSTERHDNVRSAGLPVPGAEITIMDPDPEGVGEIACRGPMVMKGYWRNPEATAKVMRDGWFMTGDAGYIDRQGFVHITGRLKNVIVTHGGKNVYPEELEEKLAGSPFIKESLVFGEPESEEVRGEKVAAIIVPDWELIRESWDEMPHARVHAEPTEEAVGQEIDRAVHEVNLHLPAYKRITGWAVHSEELPKTSTRKIKRFLYERGRRK